MNSAFVETICVGEVAVVDTIEVDHPAMVQATGTEEVVVVKVVDRVKVSSDVTVTATTAVAEDVLVVAVEEVVVVDEAVVDEEGDRIWKEHK